MEALCGSDAGPDTRVGHQVVRQRAAHGLELGPSRRLKRLDQVYADAKRGPEAFGPKLRHWDDLAGPGEANIPRWY
jgi:hypothetical protein